MSELVIPFSELPCSRCGRAALNPKVIPSCRFVWECEFCGGSNEIFAGCGGAIKKQNTCGECKHFMGFGDWDLCCKLSKRRLCYENDTACESFADREGTE